MYPVFFFFNDTATTEIYTLPLHDALPICEDAGAIAGQEVGKFSRLFARANLPTDRKSTRLNSSHGYISYAVFCLKKKIFSIRNNQKNNTGPLVLEHSRWCASPPARQVSED